MPFLIIVFTFYFYPVRNILAAMTSRLLKVFLPEKGGDKVDLHWQVALETYDQFFDESAD